MLVKYSISNIIFYLFLTESIWYFWSYQKYKKIQYLIENLDSYGQSPHHIKIKRLLKFIKNVKILGNDGLYYIISILEKKKTIKKASINHQMAFKIMAVLTYGRTKFLRKFNTFEKIQISKKIIKIFPNSTKLIKPFYDELFNCQYSPRIKPLILVNLISLSRYYYKFKLYFMGFYRVATTPLGEIWENKGYIGNIVFIPGLSGIHYICTFIKNYSKYLPINQKVLVYLPYQHEMSSYQSIKLDTSLNYLTTNMVESLSRRVIGPINLLSHCSGSTIAHLAKKNFPDLIGKVVLLDPICLMPQIFSLSNLRNFVCPVTLGSPFDKCKKQNYISWFYQEFLFKDPDIMLFIQKHYIPMEFIYLLDEPSTDVLIYLAGKDSIIDNQYCIFKINQLNLYPNAKIIYNKKSRHGSIIWGNFAEKDRNEICRFFK